MANTIYEEARQVYADGPTGAPHEPSKASIRRLFKTTADAIDGASIGRIDQATWSGLAAIEGAAAGQPARVLGPDAGTHVDPVVGGTVNNVGEYAWSAAPAGWRRIGGLVRSIVYASNTNSGDANAVTATADGAFDPTPGKALITVNFVATNSAAMTLSIDGETPRALVTNTGGPIPSGYVHAGMSALVQIDSDGNYRLFSYGDATAIAAAAEDARDLAEEARDIAVSAAAGVSNPVSYAVQTLNAAQRGQARRNIGLWAEGKPILIMAWGQSNIQSPPAFSWSPPSNLFRWNGGPISPGNAFIPCPNDYTQISLSFAAEIARANPDQPVYVVNIGRGSQPIAQWLPDPVVNESLTDMYAGGKAALEAAMSTIGVDKIDRLLWWQGESDSFAGNENYVADFNTLWFRLLQESWFPRTTPITIMAVSRNYTGDQTLRTFNNKLLQVVAMDPEFRTFVDTRYISSTYWDSTNLHMTAMGYDMAGKLAYMATFSGNGQIKAATPWRTVQKMISESRNNTATLAAEKDTTVYLQNGRRTALRGVFYAECGDVGGFKWGFVGPAFSQMSGVARILAGGAQTAIQFTDYPTDQVITTANERQPIVIDFDLRIIPTTSGNFSFQFAQNTATSASGEHVLVQDSSFIEKAMPDT